MKKNISLVFCTILSAVVLHTCLQIEVWNYLAGGNVLPREAGDKLRERIAEDERTWRRYNQDETLASGRPLTKEEQARCREETLYAKRHNQVVYWSRGMGTFQYLLAPAAIAWSVALIIRSKTRRARLFATALSAANAISIASMLYRGYFND